jgi:hypothetical protein
MLFEELDDFPIRHAVNEMSLINQIAVNAHADFASRPVRAHFVTSCEASQMNVQKNTSYNHLILEDSLHECEITMNMILKHMRSLWFYKAILIKT